MVEYKIVWGYEPYPEFDYFEKTEEEYKQNGEVFLNGKELSFEEYKKGIGNPDNHVFLICFIKARCEHCQEWSVKGSLSNIDFLNSDNWTIGEFKNVDDIKNSYQKEISLELLNEAQTETQTVKLTK